MNQKLRAAIQKSWGILAVVAVLLWAAGAQAAIVGRAISLDANLNLTTFNGDADGNTFPNTDLDFDGINENFTDGGDGFGLMRRGTVTVAAEEAETFAEGDPDDDPYPFALMDDTQWGGDSNTVPPPTGPLAIVGIVKGGTAGAITDSAPFFGLSDTINNDVAAGTIESATWLFTFGAAPGNVNVKIDMAAMGDFEAGTTSPDTFNFLVSLDGGAFAPLFTSSVDESAEQVYIMEDGTEISAAHPDVSPTHVDPVFIGATKLSNSFVTLTAAAGSPTSTLTLKFNGRTDGGSEAFAFRNILIETAAAPVLLGDYNDDGYVDARDYTVWRNNFGDLDETDINGSGDGGGVGPGDYDVWRLHYGDGTFLPGGGGIAVPEPASMALVLLGLAGLAVGRRR